MKIHLHGESRTDRRGLRLAYRDARANGVDRDMAREWVADRLESPDEVDAVAERVATKSGLTVAEVWQAVRHETRPAEPAKLILVRLREHNLDPHAWHAVRYLDDGCEHGETACVECIQSWGFDHEVAGPATVASLGLISEV